MMKAISHSSKEDTVGTQTKSLKALIAQHCVSLDAITIMNALLKVGHAENFEYESSTGSGEIKSFRKLTEEGQKFGVNKLSMGPSIRTEARFYDSSFPELLSIVVKQLSKEVSEINGSV